jgi:hypothetical protein
MNFFSILLALPDLIKLYQAIQKRINDTETDRKVKDDLKSIKKAFDEKDSSALNHIFNNKLPNETNK